MASPRRRWRAYIPVKRHHIRRALEWAGTPVLYFGLAIAKLYRRSFHETSNRVYGVADRLGVYPVIDHYHEPLVRPSAHLRHDLDSPRQLPAIDLNVAGQLDLLGQFHYQAELMAIPLEPAGLTMPYYRNLAFGAGDGELLHCMIRHFRPAQIVEVGSGESTRFAAHALAINSGHEAPPAALTCVEPYEAPWLDALATDVVRERVEDVGVEIFDRLRSGDVLFVDSSHVLRPQGDVLFIFNEVFPRLAPGVIIHVHDVFTPRDYPAKWVNRRWFWTEQYLLEGLLSYSDRFEVLLGANLLFHDHRAALFAACPVLATEADASEPASFWVRVRG